MIKEITSDLYNAIVIHKINQIKAQDMLTSSENLISVYPAADLHCAESVTGPINSLKKNNLYLGTTFTKEKDEILEVPFISDPKRAENMDYTPLIDIYDDVKDIIDEAFKGCGYELKKGHLLVDGEEVPRFDFVHTEDGNRYDFSTTTTLSSRLEMLKGLENLKQ